MSLYQSHEGSLSDLVTNGSIMLFARNKAETFVSQLQIFNRPCSITDMAQHRPVIKGKGATECKRTSNPE